MVMPEHRDTVRSNFHIRTEILLTETDEQISLLRTNISFGGIGGYARDVVKVESPVLVRMYFLQRTGEEAIEVVSGKIVWAKPDGNFTALGIGFAPLQVEDHPLLISYLTYADQFN